MKNPPKLSRRPSYADQRFVESLTDSIAFDRLLAIAEVGWLAKKPDYTSVAERPNHPDAELIEQLGIGGVRAALELDMGIKRYNPAPVIDAGTINELLIEPVRQPDFFSGAMNREASNKSTAFGAELIHEAYTVLGADADNYVKLFRDATSDEEQLHAITWLARRLTVISNEERGMVEVVTPDKEDIHYHPLRFSPKAIGAYPNHNFPPTCLGLALIGAGFFDRAGADYMHAGVMQTAGQWEAIECIELTSLALSSEMQEKFDTTMPENIADRLVDKSARTAREISEYRGTHSALVVRLQSGAWCQIDTNYRSNVMFPYFLDSDGNKLLDQHETISRIHDTLTEFSELAPGLELAEMFLEVTAQEVLQSALKNMEVSPSYRQEVTKLVNSLDDEATTEPLRVYFTDMLRNSVKRDAHLEEQAEVTNLFNFVIQSNGGAMLNSLDEDFHWVFEQFVQWQLPIDEWLRRCREDEAFRQNRIDDLMRVPLLLAIRYAYTIQDSERAPSTHTMMEFGLPAARIGRAALSNIAIYLGDDLTAHHWISQWSSQNAIIDRLGHGVRSKAQYSVLFNNLGEIEAGHLQYMGISDKISKFKEQDRE